MDIKEQKKSLRSSMFNTRIQQDRELKHKHDEGICEQLGRIVNEQNFQVIHCYIPFAGEIDIRPFMEDMLSKGKTLVCPKTLPKRQLENRVFHSFDDLEVGIKGTLHPKKEEIYLGTYDLIVVPGLAFDADLYRLGYGGGYYDTFLSSQEALKVGIFYPFQQVEQVPREDHDVRLDRVLW